jgi:hypothetical protein
MIITSNFVLLQLSKIPPKKQHLSSSSVHSELKPRSKVPVPVYPRGFPRAKQQQVNKQDDKQDKDSYGEILFLTLVLMYVFLPVFLSDPYFSNLPMMLLANH